MGASRSLLLAAAVGLAASEHAAEGGGLLPGQGGGFLAGRDDGPAASEGSSAPEQPEHRRGKSDAAAHVEVGWVRWIFAWALTGWRSGLVLVLLVLEKIWANERRERFFGYARKIMRVVGPESLDGSNEGYLVCVQGVTATAERLTDPEFNVSFTNCAKLVRKVEMYQWDEQTTTEKVARAAGTETVLRTTVRKEFSEVYHDSSQFKTRSCRNPPFLFHSSVQVATGVRLGAFSLTSELISEMGRTPGTSGSAARVHKALPPLPPACQVAGRTFWRQGGGEYVSYRGSPQVGDMRVTFRTIECGRATVLALQHGNSFMKLSHAMIPQGCSWPWSPPPARVDLSQPLLGKGKGNGNSGECRRAAAGEAVENEELIEFVEDHLSAGEMMERAECGRGSDRYLGLSFFMLFVGIFQLFENVSALPRASPWVGAWIHHPGTAAAVVAAFSCGCLRRSTARAFSWVFSLPIREPIVAVALLSFAIATVVVPDVLGIAVLLGIAWTAYARCSVGVALALLLLLLSERWFEFVKSRL